MQYRYISIGSPHPRTTLTIEQVIQLNEIEFAWDPDEESFNEWFKKLMQYKEKYGNVHVNEDCKEFGCIGKWVRETRKFYKSFCKGIRHRNPLCIERIALLEEIGFQWSLSDGKSLLNLCSCLNFRVISFGLNILLLLIIIAHFLINCLFLSQIYVLFLKFIVLYYF